MSSSESQELEPLGTIELDSAVNLSSRPKRAVALARMPITFLNRWLKRAAGVMALIGLLLGGTAVYLATGPFLHYNNTDPTEDGYVQPRSINGMVERVQNSTVTVFCDFSEEDYVQGSGWAISLPIKQAGKYPTALITNHHVIEACLNGKGKVAVKTLGGREFAAYIDRWDSENDLAVIGTVADVDPLQLSQWSPFPGYWVMAVGTADGYEGSIAFGNVLNTTDTEILITAAISHGNSGGPLVDNEGNVVGTNTWGAIGEQYNGAVSLDAMCIKIMKCEGEFYWVREE